LVSTSYLAKSETALTFKFTFFSVLSITLWSGSLTLSYKGILASSPCWDAGGFSPIYSAYLPAFLASYFLAPLPPFYAACKASSSLLLASSSSFFF